MSRPEAKGKEIPEIIVDPNTRKKYVRGRFLGKGGFAKCYELTDKESDEIYAGKIVPKSLLQKSHQREKMIQEIHIHRSVSHPHIVKFFHNFEDNDFVYVILELCRRRSLMELHKRRKAITEPEARYFVRQTLLAVQYLHEHRIIHRDLKLGNLFLNDQMDIKIGDFGLATSIEFEGERKKTLCGTPNYIAPEVLCKRGHSFEVDVWSLGCIVYTLLVGKPPFETQSLKDTYMKIKRNDYHIPSRLSPVSRALIQRLLQSDPNQRPTIRQILDDDFFTSGFLPAKLPTSCLTMAPRIDTLQRYDLQLATAQHRRPFYELNGHANEGSARCASAGGVHGYQEPVKSDRPATALQRMPSDELVRREDPADGYLSDLLEMLDQVCKSRPSKLPHANEDDAQDPASVPVYWISKWVDYSDKYGLGYQLSDNSMGVLFNDSTRLLLFQNEETTEYIERDGKEHFHTLSSYPQNLFKKFKLLKYFKDYMNEHLIKTGANVMARAADEMSRLPFLRTWFRTRSAIILHLSNGTIQINWFEDHVKLIICPLMKAITYIDQHRNFRVYSANKLEKYGCSEDFEEKIQYAANMVGRLISTRSTSARTRSGNDGPPPVGAQYMSNNLAQS